LLRALCTGIKGPLSIIAPASQEAGKPSNCSGVSIYMSDVGQGKDHATMQQLKEEIRRLREQQSAAEKIAGLVGMTSDESERYRNGIIELKA
jgi:hypothetical protein